jgi:glycine/D-amino acid oxidase-like deaminating enzyme
MMDRRTLLKLGGGGLLGAGLGACSARSDILPPQPAFRLPIVEVAWNRIIRTTVGLRPYRPSGFVLRADKLDATTVIHNYGHGGAGLSLSWGTGLKAAEMALGHESRRAAVIGCGAVGLATSRQLQRRGFEVTIYAMSVPPNTTSNMAWAGFTPAAWLVDDNMRTPEWDAQFRAAAEVSFREYQWLVGRGRGVDWLDRYNTTDIAPRDPAGARRPRREPLLPDHLISGRLRLGPGEHPFPTRYASRVSYMRIEPATYLDALVRDFMDHGGRIVIRRFTNARELVGLEESLVVNCTGLGSGDLFPDPELMPLKGQLTVLVPQSEVNYTVSGNAPGAPPGVGGFSMQPRTDGIILGGTGERGESSLEPNAAAREYIVNSNIDFFARMRRV